MQESDYLESQFSVCNFEDCTIKLFLLMITKILILEKLNSIGTVLYANPILLNTVNSCYCLALTYSAW